MDAWHKRYQVKRRKYSRKATFSGVLRDFEKACLGTRLVSLVDI